MLANVPPQRSKSRALPRWRLTSRPYGRWQMFILFRLDECRRSRASFTVWSLPSVLGYPRWAHPGIECCQQQAAEQPKPECRRIVKTATRRTGNASRTTSRHGRRVLYEWVRALRRQMRTQIVGSEHKCKVRLLRTAGSTRLKDRRCGETGRSAAGAWASETVPDVTVLSLHHHPGRFSPIGDRECGRRPDSSPTAAAGTAAGPSSVGDYGWDCGPGTSSRAVRR